MPIAVLAKTRFRHFILGGGVAGLLLAGGNCIAQSTFTNGNFTTFGEVDWNLPALADVLQNNYDSVFASTSGLVELGIPTGFTMVFDSPTALAAYLPQVGPIGALDANLLDPTSSSSGQFGGDVTALALNIALSDAGLLPENLGVHFGDLVLTNFTNLPQLNGLTVRQFSAVLNIVLGGGSYGTFTPANLDPVVDGLNTSFNWGVPGLFATELLALPQISPVIQSVSRTGSSLAFTWNTTASRQYQVQFNSSLTQTNWTSVGGILTASNTTLTASATLTNAQGFYRIELLPPQATTSTINGFLTYGQADWADNSVAEALLQDDYDLYGLYLGDPIVGSYPGGAWMYFADGDDVINYLPATGTPAPLNADLDNPTSSASGVFGGDVVALVLNINFSDAGYLARHLDVPFGDLVLHNLPRKPNGLPQLNGLTVRQFSAIVNSVLGGGVYGTYTVSNLDSVAASVNGAFPNGAASAFATNNLALP